MRSSSPQDSPRFRTRTGSPNWAKCTRDCIGRRAGSSDRALAGDRLHKLGKDKKKCSKKVVGKRTQAPNAEGPSPSPVQRLSKVAPCHLPKRIHSPFFSSNHHHPPCRPPKHPSTTSKTTPDHKHLPATGGLIKNPPSPTSKPGISSVALFRHSAFSREDQPDPTSRCHILPQATLGHQLPTLGPISGLFHPKPSIHTTHNKFHTGPPSALSISPSPIQSLAAT